MVNDFMVCVDRLMATACFEPVDSNTGRQGGGESNNSNRTVDGGGNTSGSKEKQQKQVSVLEEIEGEESVFGVVVECRICQEEDKVNSMESPCACSGSLKFAHRKCIQRWCNKKGDITCEVCSQIYSPNYSLPPARNHADGMSIDIRQAWGSHIDLNDSHFLALAAAERQLLQSEYDDYAEENSSSIACLRVVALILLVVLFIRQALLITQESGIVQEHSNFLRFQISLLQFVGFLLPCYVMARSWYIIQSRRRRQT